MFAFTLLFAFVEAFGGGPVTVTFEAVTMESCLRVQKTIVRQLSNHGASRYELKPCHEVKR